MRTKKIVAIIIAVVFVLAMLICCIALFAVKKVNVDYSVGDGTDTLSIQKELDGFLGKNLLFLDEQDIVDSLLDFHYIEVVSVKKQYPNAISVELKERREVFDIVCGGVVNVTTDDGLMLKTYSEPAVVGEPSFSRDRIRLELKGIGVMDNAFGKIISTDADELLTEVFEMAKSVQLNNCIKYIELEKGVEKQTATFHTYTGVKIVVPKILDEGVKKIETAFEKYDQNFSDYEKTFKHVEVVKLESGKIEVQWIAGQNGI